VRAEKVFVHLPALVRRGGETACEQVTFVLAQAANAAKLSQDPGHFFSMIQYYSSRAPGLAGI